MLACYSTRCATQYHMQKHSHLNAKFIFLRKLRVIPWTTKVIIYLVCIIYRNRYLKEMLRYIHYFPPLNHIRLQPSISSITRYTSPNWIHFYRYFTQSFSSTFQDAIYFLWYQMNCQFATVGGVSIHYTIYVLDSHSFSNIHMLNFTLLR